MRANQNYSNSFRYLYPSQCESFRTNPKNVLYLTWWKAVKNRSDLIRFNSRQQSEWIRTNPKPSFLPESIRARIDSNRIFNQNQSEWIQGWNDSNWFWLKIRFGSIGLIRIDPDWKLSFGLVRIHLDWCLGVHRINSDWFTLTQINISEWIGIVLIGSEWIPIRYFHQGNWQLKTSKRLRVSE